MIRRFAGVASAASLLAIAGLSTVSTAPAAAATVDVCTVNGTASIAPGLGPVPGAQNTNFTGAIACNGTTPGSGSFSGTVPCLLGSIELGVGCSLSYAATGVGAGQNCNASPAFLQVAAVVVEACVQTNGDVEAGAVVFTPAPLVQNPVLTVSFTGAAAIAGAA
jgi:hypothetical protein